MSCHVPFEERKTPWRGALDFVAGCYPCFLFGGSANGILPVFHFHDVTPGCLEPYLQYLAENNYKTVTSQAIADFAKKGAQPGPRAVAITFDDAWLSLWTVAFPLLKKYRFTAIAYVSPAQISGAVQTRPTMSDPAWKAPTKENTEFASWPELKALAQSGVMDIQAHSFSHSMIFCDSTVIGFVTPGYNPHIHLRPFLDDNGSGRYVSAVDLGCPLYTQRSRMSDAFRFFEPVEARTRCMEIVRQGGGAAFFDRPDWKAVLSRTAEKPSGRLETADEQRKAIRNELLSAREMLSQQLGGYDVRHMCFPFSICGKTAQSLLEETGYETAFADELFGFRAVKTGSNPYRLMRLKHQFIYCLPGKGRLGFMAAWNRIRTSGTAE